MRIALMAIVWTVIVALSCCFVEAADGINDPGAAVPRAAVAGENFRPDVFSYRMQYRESVDLNGPWQFLRDPDEIGVAEGWQHGTAEAAGTVNIPGVPQAQGYGEPRRVAGKWPGGTATSHQHQRTYFMEPFWLWRDFELRELRDRERVWFRLGGVLPAAKLFINGQYVGYTKSSRTQERVDVTRWVKPGRNRAAIKVCDFPEVRLCGLLEWNETTQHWMGAYRPIYLEITDRDMVIDAYLQPRLADDALDVRFWLSQSSEAALTVELTVKNHAEVMATGTLRAVPGDEEVEGRVFLEDYVTWSPESPQLYTLEVTLRDGASGAVRDQCGFRFGMREIRTEGTKIYLNGRPIFWRIFGDDLYYPETLAPAPNIDWYLPRLRLARQYGMNGVKGCVDTLSQEYIEACDEAGILVIQELPFGLSTLRANRHTIEEPFVSFQKQELSGLVRVSRNHASVVAYSMSSELSFGAQTQQSFDFFSRDLPALTRELAPHALVIDCTGYVNELDTRKGARDTDFYASVHPQWMKEVLEEVDMISDHKRPLVLHEYNWWSCYPDPADRALYENAQLLPFWLDELVATATARGQAELIPTYRKNSLWLQTIARKDGIEYARRNANIEGYILWLLIDFGHWSEGLLDDFWNPKNVSPQEFMQSNGETVIVLAEEGNRVLPMEQPGRIPLGVCHYGERDYPDSSVHWSVEYSKGIIGQGVLPIDALREGFFNVVGDAVFDLPDQETGYKIDIRATLKTRDGDVVNTNEWSFWAFPEVVDELATITRARNHGETIMDSVFIRLGRAVEAEIPEDTTLVIADGVDQTLVEFVAGGGNCLLFSRAAEIENRTPYHGKHTFYGIFRTIPWNAGSAGNSGTVVSEHPALADFPHEGFCDLSWVWMLRGFYPMEFEPLREYGVTPIIRNIDSYRVNRNNAFMLEFNAGEGRVLATTVGVLPQLRERLEARYLLHCLVTYAMSDAFAPVVEVPEAEFLRLFSQKVEGERNLPRSSVDRMLTHIDDDDPDDP